MRAPAIVTAALLLAACMQGPNHVRPETTAPPAWRHVPDNWKPAEPRDRLARGDWWTLFNDAALGALAERASRANLSVVAADARYRQAQAVAAQARAGLLPTLDVGASRTLSRAPNATTTARSNQFDFGASWEPDLWGRVRRSVEQGESLAGASAADLESLRLSVVAALVQDYYALRVADAQAKLLADTISGYAQLLKLTQNRYQAGVAAKSDVVQAETQLRSTQAQLADLGLQRAQLEHSIAVLMGEAPAGFRLAPVAALADAPQVPLALPSALLERRPDISAAERRVAAANARIGIAQSAFFPALVLSGDAGWRSARIGDLFSTPARFWSLGAAAATLLFDGGARKAVEEQARAAWDAEVATYRGTVLAAFQEVEDNLVALRSLEDEMKLQADAVRGARESVEMITNRYKAGTASFLDIIAVQNILLSNERTLVTLQGRRLAAAVLLVRALGGGWGGLP